MVEGYLNPPIEAPLFNQVIIFNDIMYNVETNALCKLCEFFDIRLLGRIDDGN